MKTCCEKRFEGYCLLCQSDTAEGTLFRRRLNLSSIPVCPFPTKQPTFPLEAFVNGIRQVFFYHGEPYRYTSSADGFHIYHSSTGTPSVIMYCYQTNDTQVDGLWYTSTGALIPTEEVAC